MEDLGVFVRKLSQYKTKYLSTDRHCQITQSEIRGIYYRDSKVYKFLEI